MEVLIALRCTVLDALYPALMLASSSSSQSCQLERLVLVAVITFSNGLSLVMDAGIQDYSCLNLTAVVQGSRRCCMQIFRIFRFSVPDRQLETENTQNSPVNTAPRLNCM